MCVYVIISVIAIGGGRCKLRRKKKINSQIRWKKTLLLSFTHLAFQGLLLVLFQIDLFVVTLFKSSLSNSDGEETFYSYLVFYLFLHYVQAHHLCLQTETSIRSRLRSKHSQQTLSLIVFGQWFCQNGSKKCHITSFLMEKRE